ncbi:MAG: cell wall hydrolase [Phyllobacteriaceae bacterium]|nr:cell wall hydrolase [Phyllobacteriaceae bacterium]
MRNSSKKRPSLVPSLARRIRDSLFPVCVGTALFLTYPSLVAYQDVASFLGAGGVPAPAERWLASATAAPGVSMLTTGSIGKAAAATPQAAPAEITTDIRIERQPQTVNRTLKGDRVVSTTFVSPPESFNAGRVYERHSLLGPLNVGKKVELAFVKAKPFEEALQVASAFHPRRRSGSDLLTPKPDLPVMVASLVTESASNLLAYSQEPEFLRSPFAEVLEDNSPISIVPKLGEGDHAWAADPLPKSSYSDREQHCLTAGIYFEARGEPVKGQAAVAQVILNRVRNPTYPDTICGVVYQNKNWRNRCQFSFACDRISDKVRDPKRWNIAKYVARETTEGRIWLKEVGSSTHYHATYVQPRWASHMKKVGRIGLHIFYRTFGGGWS